MHGKFDGLGRFADPSLLILTSLADGPRHGYAIMTDVAAFSGVPWSPAPCTGRCRGWSAAAGCGRWPPRSAAVRTRSPRRAGGAGRAAGDHAADRTHRPAAHRHGLRTRDEARAGRPAVPRPGGLLPAPLAAALRARRLLAVLDQHQPERPDRAQPGRRRLSTHLDPAWHGPGPACRSCAPTALTSAGPSSSCSVRRSPGGSTPRTGRTATGTSASGQRERHGLRPRPAHPGPAPPASMDGTDTLWNIASPAEPRRLAGVRGRGAHDAVPGRPHGGHRLVRRSAPCGT